MSSPLKIFVLFKDTNKKQAFRNRKACHITHFQTETVVSMYVKSTILLSPKLGQFHLNLFRRQSQKTVVRRRRL